MDIIVCCRRRIKRMERKENAWTGKNEHIKIGWAFISRNEGGVDITSAINISKEFRDSVDKIYVKKGYFANNRYIMTDEEVYDNGLETVAMFKSKKALVRFKLVI